MANNPRDDLPENLWEPEDDWDSSTWNNDPWDVFLPDDSSEEPQQGDFLS